MSKFQFKLQERKLFKSFFLTGILFLIFVGAQHVVPLQRDVFAASASNAAVANAVATYQETTYFIHQDNLGSVVAVTDQSGNNVVQNSYNSYGSPSNETMEQFSNDQSVNKGITERAYTGQIRDAVTSLNYYNARYYDSTLSRFISSDSVQGENRFAYVGGNPISNSDPSGNMFINEDGGLKVKEKLEIVDIVKANYHSQEEVLNSVNGCGPTDLSMLMKNKTPEQVAAEMQKQGFFDRSSGSTFSEMKKYLKTLGYNPKVFEDRKEGGIHELFDNIKKFDQPAIVAVKTKFDLNGNRHFVVVFGQKEINNHKFVLIYDSYLYKTKIEEIKDAYVVKQLLFVPIETFTANYEAEGFDSMFYDEVFDKDLQNENGFPL